MRATTSGHKTYTDYALGWGRIITGGVEIHDVPGDHLSMLHSPHVHVLIQRLTECLQAAERSG